MMTSRFLDQRRSVGFPYWWRHIFWIRRSPLDPPVGDITFFGSKEVPWIPLLVTSRFLDQRRSVGSPCWWRHIFGQKDVSLIPLLLSSRFWTTFGIPWGLCLSSVCLSFCNIFSSPPIFQGLRLSVCSVSSSPILTWKVHFCFCDVSLTTTSTKLSTAGTQQDVDKTPKLYSGPTIQSRLCRP